MKLAAKQVVLDEDKMPDLKRAAAEKGVSVSAIIRWAIDQYIDTLFLPANSINPIVEEVQSTELQAA
jgi:hypothetical protein